MIDDDLEPDEDYLIALPVFAAQFPGYCAIDRNHLIKKGDHVARVKKANNPFIHISGVACRHCTRHYPKAT